MMNNSQSVLSPAMTRMLKILSCLPVLMLGQFSAAAENLILVNDEIYHESDVENNPSIINRAMPSPSLVVTKSSRDTFFDIFSNIERFKSDQALWKNTQNGRRTLTNMKYVICPIWLADEANVPANVTSMNSVMQQNKEFYGRMSWNQHEVTWDFLDDVKLVNHSSINDPTLDQVADACKDYMTNVRGKKYPDTHTGLIVAYKPTKSGELSGRGGVGVINYNFTWMSLEFGYKVTRHELGHNYGHPHHFAYSYGWRFSRGFSTDVIDGYDMMSGGNYEVEAHISAASKYFFNWIINDAIVTLQPEGPTAACRYCMKSISNVVLKPFDNSDIVPSKSNLMAVHIPVLGVGDSNVYSYWLSYRTNYTDARNGLSMHLAKFNLGGMFGALFQSLNFDAIGDTSTTSDSFILNGTCYVIQPPGVLMDIDRTSVEQIQPVICVNDIDKGKSITISVSFLNKETPTKAFKKQNALRCSKITSNVGPKLLDMVSNNVHMLEYNGTGQDGSVTLSLCLATGSASIRAYFYDSYPYAYLSYKAPPSYGAFLSVQASTTCANASVTKYSSENGQTFVLIIADGPVPSGTTVQYESTCTVNTCHIGQYMDVEKGICLSCPRGHVSTTGSVALNSCISCIADGLEPVGVFSKDCKISLNAYPSLNTAKSWRIFLPAEQSVTGYSAGVEELEFYSSDDCSAQSKISTAGGIAFSSGYYDNNTNWRPELAFNAGGGNWGGRPDSRNLLYLGITFNRTVTVKCIKYIQPTLMVKELRIQAKPENQENWNNVLIVRSIPNTTNIIPIIAVPTNAPNLIPTTAPTLTKVVPTNVFPTNAPPMIPVTAPASTPSVGSVTTAPIFITLGETACSNSENVCRGGIFRLFQSGQTMHRTFLGRCQERCSTFTLFRGFMGLFGWKCGACP